MIYVHDGLSATILYEFASPSTGPYGLTWNGSHLISCDLSLSEIFIHANSDKFKWSVGSVFSDELVLNTGSKFDLDDGTTDYGITIQFNSPYGHTVGNYWSFTQGAMRGLVITDSAGNEYFSASNGNIDAKKIWIKAQPVTVKKDTWARIVEFRSSGEVRGCSFIVHINGTRGNVVWNSTWVVNYCHNLHGNLSQLGAGSYTNTRIRTCVDATTGGYLEFYDNGDSAATYQTIYVSILGLDGWQNVIPTFTVGSRAAPYSGGSEKTGVGDGIKATNIIQG